MAGLFGKSKKFNPLAAVREEPGLAERLANQVGMNLLGVDFIGMGRRKALGEAQRGFMNDLTGKLGPQYEDGPAPTVGEGGNAEAWEYTPPTRTSDGLNINSPELPALALTAQRLGVPLKGLIDVMAAQQPDVRFDRGFGYNSKTGGAMGGFHPELDKGQTLGANGVVSNLPGFVNSSAEAEGAKTGAQEQQKAAWDLVEVPQRDGSVIKLPRAIAVPMLAKAAQESGGPGFGRSQTPAEAAAARVQAESQAAARTSLPNDLSTVDAAINSIDNLLKDPALPKRTGMWAMLPAIPGTEGAGFDTQLKQLTGQVFLDAYASLKGAGAITEQEGKAATAAKARLEKAQSPEDFMAALNDLRASLLAGKQRLAQRAGAPPAGAGRWTAEAARAELARRRAAAGAR